MGTSADSTSDFDRQRRLQAWLGALLGYTILVILWGAWVRISHSGDGCGASWPLCEGQFVPNAPRPKTLVELSHRLMSGLFGIFILAGFLSTRRRFPVGHRARFWALASLILTVTEALLGAKLVLFGLVGENSSGFRVFAMGLHFVNSAFLVGSICLWGLSSDPFLQKSINTVWGVLTKKAVRILRGGAIAGLLLLGVTGTIAALSTTLFPSESLTAGLSADFQEQAHFLQRWRISHPLLGLTFGSLGIVLFLVLARAIPREFGWIRWRTHRTAVMCLITTVVGTVTLFLLSPVSLKLVHLACAHMLWVSLVAWMYGFLYEPTGAPAHRPILFFDGICHLCHGSVVKLLQWDQRGLILFAPLQGSMAKRVLPAAIQDGLKSVIYYEDGKILEKSDAVIASLRMLPAEFRILAFLMSLIPRFLRDGVYNWIAKNRYGWFGQLDVCQLPSTAEPAQKLRFLD